MKTPFEQCFANTDDEYRKLIEKRIRRYYVILFLGMITILLSILNMTTDIIQLSDFSDGFYLGVGSGLVSVSILKIIKYKKMLKNEKMLHKDRLENQDERNIMIAEKSLNYAAVSMLILAYVGMIFLGVKSNIAFSFCLLQICVFVCVYVVSFCILRKR